MGSTTSVSNNNVIDKKDFFKFLDKHVQGDPEGIVVVSTFDGISALQVAFQRLGIKVKKYYVYEIDPYAISVTRKHFPKTVFLGDITQADPSFFKDIRVDFFSGGFPCQNYSVAGNNMGTKGETGKLLYPMIDLYKALKKMNPHMDFFFENVRMKKEFLDEVNEIIGVKPQLWNSALVSGQNRLRFYWTSLDHVFSIEDRNIFLSDVLEPIVDAKYCVGRNLVKNYKGGNQLNPTYKSQANTIHDPSKKSCTVSSGTHGYAIGYIPSEKASIFASRGRYNKDGSTTQQMEFRFDNKTNAITTIQKDNYLEMSDDMAVEVAIDQEKKKSCNQIGLMVEKVKIRKHEVDIPNLQKVLRSAKTSSGKTNKQIAEETSVPLTKVEHWFRTDSSFAIPSDDIWHKLKDVIGIDVDTFDKQIMEFEYRDGVYESSQRVYSEHGKSPTITTANITQWIETNNCEGVEVAITEGVDLVGNQARETLRTNIHKGSTLMARDYKGFGNQGQTAVKTRCIQVGEADLKKADGTMYSNEQLRRVYSPLGKSPNVDTQGGGHREIKVITSETTYRKLTPTECARLQTFEDDYCNYGINEKGETVKISDTQKYKMLGNSWTIEMVVELLRSYQPKMAIAV